AMQDRVDFAAQLARRTKRAVGPEVARIRAIERAGDVTGNGIERLDVAAIALGGARIEQQQIVAWQACRDAHRTDGGTYKRRHESRLLDSRRFRRDGPPFAL